MLFWGVSVFFKVCFVDVKQTTDFRHLTFDKGERTKDKKQEPTNELFRGFFFIANKLHITSLRHIQKINITKTGNKCKKIRNFGVLLKTKRYAKNTDIRLWFSIHSAYCT